ncbi:LuxR C-terminal-related transcriptional regulator [Sulfurimonas sp.]|uniref:response regulator transcription factor n=1 Tax=Sulfurimonas sp. TaxID=2022749 RepID=UPI0025CD6D9E|nr:LuxR C-terminal-related transcriptional regulator [Sulfurimonas sp.]MBW6488209.1 LuxR C-terminal-related transcriptional regulator [Sulfurimonas sp.]
MKIIFFSSSINIIDEFKTRDAIKENTICYDAEGLKSELKKSPQSIVIADYDSIASDINGMISSGFIPKRLVVLEKEPSVVTGRRLILLGAKAYGNSRMLNNHFTQMLNTVTDGDIWTYPELTAQLVKKSKKPSIDDESKKLIEDRLSDKEQDVVYLMLEGLTNDAIASSLNITTRTVKAHVSSIFNKLHVNDRVSLILLLR